MHGKTVSPGITSWPGGKVATAVAVCTPLVRLPAVSPSPTYRIRTFMRLKRERSVLPVSFMCFLSVLSPGLKKLSPSGGWLRLGCLFSVILTGGGRVVVWPSGLRASSVGNRLLTQPGLHLWVLVLEPLSQAGTPQRPGPDRQTVKREQQKLTPPPYNQMTQCDCKGTKRTEEFFNRTPSDSLLSTFAVLLPLNVCWDPRRQHLLCPWVVWEPKSQAESPWWGGWNKGGSGQIRWADAWGCFLLLDELLKTGKIERKWQWNLFIPYVTSFFPSCYS